MEKAKRKRNRKKKALSKAWPLPPFFWTEMEAFFRRIPCCLLCVIGSISVSANMWHGSEIVWDLDEPKVCTASRDSQAFCCQTGLLPCVFFLSWVAALLVALYAVAVICVVSCKLTKWEGLRVTHGWILSVEFLSALRPSSSPSAPDTVQPAQNGCSPVLVAAQQQVCVPGRAACHLHRDPR